MADAGGAAAVVFKAAHAAGADWARAVKACVEKLGEVPPGANLGLLYATDALAGDLSSVLTFLRETTRIAAWTGSVGAGIAASGSEYYDGPALAILVAALPEDSFRVFGPVKDAASGGGMVEFGSAHGPWLRRHQPLFGIAHGDPRNPQIARVVADVAAGSATFLVGGLTSSRRETLQIADRVIDGGLSGVFLAPQLPVATGLTQGCTPIGAAHTISAAVDDVILTLDGRPALEVLEERVGALLRRDPRHVGGDIHVAFLVSGSDTGDYIVRDLVSVDSDKGWFSANHVGAPGQRLMFCRRDEAAARADLQRMVAQVKQRAGPAPKAGVYYSCVARGRHLFGPRSQELTLIRDELGDIPLVGFFGNGEICNDRLYGYTGVLALFH